MRFHGDTVSSLSRLWNLCLFVFLHYYWSIALFWSHISIHLLIYLLIMFLPVTNVTPWDHSCFLFLLILFLKVTYGSLLFYFVIKVCFSGSGFINLVGQSQEPLMMSPLCLSKMSETKERRQKLWVKERNKEVCDPSKRHKRGRMRT